jgi:hypothetical protein
MPTNSNTVERIRTAVKIPRAGCPRTYADSTIEIVPMLICNTSTRWALSLISVETWSQWHFAL